MSDPTAPRNPEAPSAADFRPPHDQGQMWSDDGTSRAEIAVVEGRLELTFALPDIPADRIAHFVGSNILVLWSKDDPETQRTVVRLPEDVVPDSSVARITNGVFDLTALIAPPTHDEHRPDGSA